MYMNTSYLFIFHYINKLTISYIFLVIVPRYVIWHCIGKNPQFITKKGKKEITNNERKKKSDLHIDYTLVEAHNTVAPADTSSISRIDNDDSCLGKRPLCF